MRELGFYQKELDRLVNVEGTIEAAQRKQGEMEALLAGREPARLNTADREQYDNLVNELNDILRKMELEKIINRYNDLDSALTSEAAMDHELERINEIIEYREQAEQNPGTLENRSILLTVPEGQAVINETVEEARAVLILRDNRPPIYEGSGLAASKQVATLRSILNSGRDLTPRQRSTIQGMIRAFDNIITNEYDYDQRSQREQGGEETVAEQEIEVVRKSHINDKIEAQNKQKRISEIVIEMTKIKAEIDSPEYDNYTEEQKRELEDRRYKLQVEGAELNGVDSSKFNGPYYDLKWPRLSDEQRAQNDQERARITEENQEAIDYADDVTPVLTQLQQLENVPGIEFEAIYAQEVDRMLEEYRRQLAELESSQRTQVDQDSHEFDNLSDEELQNLIQQLESEIDEEWQFRVWQQNGLEENNDDPIGRLAKLQKELARRKQEQTQEQGQKGKYDSMSIEDIENRIQELEEQIQEEWQFGAQEQNGIEQNDDDTLDKLTKEQKELKEELEKRKIIEKYKGKSDEDLKNRLSEIDEEINEEWQFRAHEQNGLEQNDDDTLDKLLREKKEIEEELKRREKERENENGKDNSREIKRLKNIIKELEGLEREKTKIITKEKKKTKHPKPKPIPGNDRGIDPPGPPNPPEPPNPPGQTLPRHWVEIMAEMQTESSGSIATYFHNMGKIQPFKLGITLWAAPLKLAMWGTGKLFGDVIGRVNHKKELMRKNLVKLAKDKPEEFETLVQGLTETNMRQYKVNEAFLDVVQEVLEAREAPKKQLAINQDNTIRTAMATEEEKIDDIKNQLANPALLPAKKLQLQQELQNHSMVYNALGVKHAQQYAIQESIDKRLQDFERGKRGKSTGKMNIPGWLAGSFNPDNRDIHQEEANYLKQMREAAQNGENTKVTELQRQIEALHVENSNEIQLLKGTRFADRARISRGKHKVEEVHQRSNDADQTKAKELIATIMAGVSVANIFTNSKVNNNLQQQVNDHLDKHNADVRSVNAANAKLQQNITNVNAHNKTLDSQIASARGQVTQSDLRNAGMSEIHRNNASAYSIRHEAEFLRENTPGVGFNHGGSDDAIHAAQSTMTSSRINVMRSGDMRDISNEVAQSGQRVQQAAQQVVPDVSKFTSIPGKSGYVNTEYVQNLQNLSNGTTNSFELLNKLFTSVRGMDQPELITGTVQNVSEIPGLVLTMPAAAMTNWLPFIVSMVNVGHLEQQKMNYTRKEIEAKRERSNERQKSNGNDERRIPENTENQNEER